MTENEFAERVQKLCYFHASQIAKCGHDDLAQVGAIGALKLFRQAGGVMPDLPLIHCAIRRAIIDEIRHAHSVKRSPRDERVPIYEGNSLASQEDNERDVIRKIDLERALDTLPLIERSIVKRSLAGETLEQIGRRLQVCGTRISQMRTKAIRKLRAFLAP